MTWPLLGRQRRAGYWHAADGGVCNDDAAAAGVSR